MANNLFITATEARSGKSAISLGIMELLIRKVGRVAFFRPIIDADDPGHDNDIQLFSTHFKLGTPFDKMFACTLAKASNLIGSGRQDDLLEEIAVSSARTAQTFDVAPRVAMLSYSTGLSGTGADVDKVREATRLARELAAAQELDIKIEGPIQYDAAIDPIVAGIKLPGSDVAGKATVFIFPDLNTGNNTYKAVQRSAGAVAIGPVLQGLNKPVNDLSRGCTVSDVVNTIAITAIQAAAEKETS